MVTTGGFPVFYFKTWSKGVRLCFWDLHVCDCRLSAVITNSAAQPRRTTVASAAAAAHPAGWCEDTTNPSTTQEKVNNHVLFFLWGIRTPPNALVAGCGSALDTHHCFSSVIPHTWLQFVSLLVFLYTLVSVSHKRHCWWAAEQVRSSPTLLCLVFLQLKTPWSSFPMAVATFVSSWKVQITCVSPGRSRVCLQPPSQWNHDMTDISYGC